jgi:hypothetical protein
MTDQELIERLRWMPSRGGTGEQKTCDKAADRIEELVKELNISRIASVVMDNTVEELHVKLTKAMAGLRKIADHKHFSRDQGWTQNAEARIASTALAELEGGE